MRLLVSGGKYQVATYFLPITVLSSERSHSLCISVMPLSSDGVLLEQGGDPLLTLGLTFAGRLPLSFLQDELLVGGLGLVLVVDGPGHMLPQSDGSRGNKVRG